MKYIFSMVLILALGFSSRAQYEKVSFQASGLTCSMCSKAIFKAVKTLPFAESVQTDLNNNEFTILFRKDSNPDFDLIKTKVEQAGFSIAKFWIWLRIPNLQLKSEEHLALYGKNFHLMNIKPQSVQGDLRLQIIDKGYVPDKEFKKYGTLTTMPCYQSGRMDSCCKSATGELAGSNRIYHVTI
jgi:copper chaperone CopZ